MLVLLLYSGSALLLACGLHASVVVNMLQDRDHMQVLVMVAWLLMPVGNRNRRSCQQWLILLQMLTGIFIS